jgi:hypothetical protein
VRVRAAALVALVAAACSSPTTLPLLQGADPTPLVVRLEADPPFDADGRVWRDATLVLACDDYPDPDAIGFGPVLLSSGVANLDVSLSVDLLARAVRVKPRNALAAGGQYELTIVGGMRALDGRVVGGSGAHFTFDANGARANPPPPAPVAYADVAAIFAASCVTGCHSTEVPRRGLDLTRPGDATFGLINVPAVGLAGTVRPLARVVPGDSARSDLMRKVLDGHLGVDGARMPPGPPLPAEQLRTIQRWIDQGAPL